MFPGQLRPRFARHDRGKRVGLLVILGVFFVVGIVIPDVVGIVIPDSVPFLWPARLVAIVLVAVAAQLAFWARVAGIRSVAVGLASRHPGRFVVGNVQDDPASVLPGERAYHSRIIQVEPHALTIWDPDVPQVPLEEIPLRDAELTVSESASGIPARLHVRTPDDSHAAVLSIYRDRGLAARDADEIDALLSVAAVP